MFLSVVPAVASPARAAVPVRVPVEFVLDAQGNRGTASGIFSQLTASQAQQIVEVFGDLMSYHDSNDRIFLSRRQMDRNSAQAWSDRGWMLARPPVYVSPTAAAGGNSGSWSNPYASLEEAISGGTLDDRVMALLAAAHALAGPLTADAPARCGRRSRWRSVSPGRGRPTRRRRAVDRSARRPGGPRLGRAFPGPRGAATGEEMTAPTSRRGRDLWAQTRSTTSRHARFGVRVVREEWDVGAGAACPLDPDR